MKHTWGKKKNFPTKNFPTKRKEKKHIYEDKTHLNIMRKHTCHVVYPVVLNESLLRSVLKYNREAFILTFYFLFYFYIEDRINLRCKQFYISFLFQCFVLKLIIIS